MSCIILRPAFCLSRGRIHNPLFAFPFCCPNIHGWRLKLRRTCAGSAGGDRLEELRHLGELFGGELPEVAVPFHGDVVVDPIAVDLRLPFLARYHFMVSTVSRLRSTASMVVISTSPFALWTRFSATTGVSATSIILSARQSKPIPRARL